MVCENCNENEATVHYTEIVNGIRTEHHLCSECAGKLDLSGYASVLDSDFPFVKLLTGLLASNGLIGEEIDNPMLHVKCPQCGMNFEEFTHVGKFGCAECYNVFGPLIEDNMKKIHGSSEHRGKNYKIIEHKEAHNKAGTKITKIGNKNTRKSIEREKTTDILDEVADLNAKLKEAVEMENYEAAALYRDEIKELKERKGKDA
jgi:protein arginine kinase activator